MVLAQTQALFSPAQKVVTVANVSAKERNAEAINYSTS